MSSNSNSNSLSGVNNSEAISRIIANAINGIDYTISDTAFIAASYPKYAI